MLTVVGGKFAGLVFVAEVSGTVNMNLEQGRSIAWGGSGVYNVRFVDGIFLF